MEGRERSEQGKEGFCLDARENDLIVGISKAVINNVPENTGVTRIPFKTYNFKDDIDINYERTKSFYPPRVLILKSRPIRSEMFMCKFFNITENFQIKKTLY